MSLVAEGTAVSVSRQLAELLDEPLDWRFKGFPPVTGVTIGTVGEQRWNLLAGDVPLPMLALKESALAHNVELLASFCRENGASFAPHGKTTMAPQLFERQLDAGAWAMTVAHVSQARVCRAFGIQRIVIANEVVEPLSLRWLLEELDGDDDFDCYCLVDSVAAVALMTSALGSSGHRRRLAVLIELGTQDGRAGCRSSREIAAVAAAVQASPSLELAGVETFEGILDSADTDASEQAVDRLLARVAEATEQLDAEGFFDGREEIIVTAGGSVFFDRVTAQLGALALSRPSRLVLRSGCYLTHDSGIYDERSPFGAHATGTRRLLPALEAWGTVLSRPEPGLAIVSLGKRDVPYDAGLPTPLSIARDGKLRPAPDGMRLTRLNDQHAFITIPTDDPLGVGDLVGCGISHPCTAFDRWTLLALVDDDYTVTGAVRTFF